MSLEPGDVAPEDLPAAPMQRPTEGAQERTLSGKTRRRLRILAFGMLPGLFLSVLAVGLFRTEEPKARPGAPAPDFSLPDLGGGTLASADLRGSPVVVNFWASWCVPCREEAPTLEATYKQYQGQGVRFVGIDYEDIDTDAASFVSEFGITYPSVRDPGGTLATAFGVRGVPETFFIDGNWRFFSIGQGSQVGARGATKILGAVSRQELVSQIQQLLASTRAP